jgi:hypothetical protein
VVRRGGRADGGSVKRPAGRPTAAGLLVARCVGIDNVARCKGHWSSGDRERPRVPALALGLAAVVVLAAAPGAMASPLRGIAPSTRAFASDGERYAAWQAPRDPRISLLDTRDGKQRAVEPPTGCRLHDGAEDGEPVASAADGRFLLECEEGDGQALLDVRTGRSVPLPKKRNGTSDWYRVGTRYVMGVNVLYDIATGASRPLKNVADLDRPGASTNGICPAVRRLVTHNPWQGWRKGYAFHGEIFAHRSGTTGNVQLEHCHGPPTVLHARGGPDVCRGEPLNFDLRGGLLSWDTGCEGDGPEPDEPDFRGRLYSYALSTHGRASWPLPKLTVRGGEEPIRGTFGYSTHTANTVFWIAARTLGGGKGLYVETSAVFAARL